jgi:glycosyltransferase involved in cell wall biosynthesis
MKINYVAYLDPWQHHGGGERVLRQLLDSGRNRGHDIRLITLSPSQRQSFPNADLTILADLFNNPLLFHRFSQNQIEAIIDKERYIHFDNAYVDCCNLDYLPCSGHQQVRCPHKSWYQLERILRARDVTRDCFQQRPLIQKLYRRSLFNVFVSPLHRRVIHQMLALPENRRSFILRPLIDTTVFTNLEKPRDLPYLFVGVISEAKGFHHLRSGYADKEIFLVGEVHPHCRLDFGTYLGKRDYAEIPVLMNRAVNFVYLPRWPEPQGRVVVEAALCGCQLITNENVGATSFDFDISNPANLKRADEEFWEVLEGVH